MRALFAISVLCLCAVLWVAVSIARHVLATRRHRRPARRSQEGFTEVFFDDKMQQIREHAAISRQAAATTEARSSWMSAPIRPEPAGLPVARPVYQTPAAPAPVAQAIEQPIAQPIAQPAEQFTVQPVAPVATPLAPPISVQATVADVPLLRKAPQPVSANGLYRADWDYFNKDLGDLTDPYEDTLRDRSEPKSGTRY